jgi:hypothetical protein
MTLNGPGPVSISEPNGRNIRPPGRIDPAAATIGYRSPPGGRNSAAEARRTAKAAAISPKARKICNLRISTGVVVLDEGWQPFQCLHVFLVGDIAASHGGGLREMERGVLAELPDRVTKITRSPRVVLSVRPKKDL